MSELGSYGTYKKFMFISYSHSDEISIFRFLKVFKKLNPSLTTGLGDENLERYCDDDFSTNENKKIT